MPNLSEYKRSDNGIFALVKGGPNTGKTTALLSFPNICVLDFDIKMPGVALKHYPDRKDISWEHFKNIFELSDLLKKWHGNCPYETILVDSVTSLSGLCIRSTGEVKGEDVFSRLKDVKNEVETMRRKGKKQEDIDDYVKPIGLDYYNTETSFFCSYFIDQLKNMWMGPGNPKNVLVIAHVITYESGPKLNTGQTTKEKMILTTGRKPATWIPTQFDDEWTFVLKGEPFSGKEPARYCQFVPIDEEVSRTTLAMGQNRELLLDKPTKFYDNIKEKMGF